MGFSYLEIYHVSRTAGSVAAGLDRGKPAVRELDAFRSKRRRGASFHLADTIDGWSAGVDHDPRFADEWDGGAGVDRS
jgi:hypothetical protein